MKIKILMKFFHVTQFTPLAAYDQANLASTDNAAQISAQFASGSDSGSTAFGGQDSLQQNQYGGHYSSTT